ncbi:hypothetical protein XM79_c11344 [Vibrio vulnificus]|nr:hypothetical protein XM78_c11343 [Vibrio vulnificus]OQK66958.1 hypothetical protein XM79_c11344 [Vibrio vulnificus]
MTKTGACMGSGFLCCLQFGLSNRSYKQAAIKKSLDFCRGSFFKVRFRIYNTLHAKPLR